MPTCDELLALYQICASCRDRGLPPEIDCLARHLGEGKTENDALRVILSLIRQGLIKRAQSVGRSLWPTAEGWRLAGMDDEAVFEEAVERRLKGGEASASLA